MLHATLTLPPRCEAAHGLTHILSRPGEGDAKPALAQARAGLLEVDPGCHLWGGGGGLSRVHGGEAEAGQMGGEGGKVWGGDEMGD